MLGKWTFSVIRDLSSWRWKLVNREGHLVMFSPHTYPSEAGAHLAAEYEQIELRHTILES